MRLKSGMRVRVAGLQAKPELNGQEGSLLEFNEQEGRWQVWMHDGSGKLLRPTNLVPCGEETGGTGIQPDSPSCHPKSFPSALPQESEPLRPGARVRVHGLVA